MNSHTVRIHFTCRHLGWRIESPPSDTRSWFWSFSESFSSSAFPPTRLWLMFFSINLTTLILLVCYPTSDKKSSSLQGYNYNNIFIKWWEQTRWRESTAWEFPQPHGLSVPLKLCLILPASSARSQMCSFVHFVFRVTGESSPGWRPHVLYFREVCKRQTTYFGIWL